MMGQQLPTDSTNCSARPVILWQWNGLLKDTLQVKDNIGEYLILAPQCAGRSQEDVQPKTTKMHDRTSEELIPACGCTTPPYSHAFFRDLCTPVQ